MFRRNRAVDQVQDQSSSAATSLVALARDRLTPTMRERVIPVVGQAAYSARDWSAPRAAAARGWAGPRVGHGVDAAKDWAGPKAAGARDWAAPRLESGLDAAAPKVQDAVQAIGPKVDSARDTLVDEVLPRISEALEALAGHRDLSTRSSDAASALAGKPKRRRGKVFLFLGVVAAAAAIAVVLKDRLASRRDDPWDTPLSEPYVAPSSSTSTVATASPDVAAGSAADVAPDVSESQADAGVAVDEGGSADDPISDTTTLDVEPVEGTQAAEGSDAEGEPRQNG